MFAKLTAVILSLFMAAPAMADNWRPQKTIEIVVPYPPGGATDKWGRVVADILTAHGWPAVVVNRPGADTVIGSNYVAKSEPDGHTLYIGGNGFLDANLAFRNRPAGIEYTENSFTPIVPLGAGTAVLVVSSKVPVSNYEEFKAWVKQNPASFNLGFWNSYTANVFYEWARQEKLPAPNIVFYKGSAPQVADVVGGHIPFVFDTYTAIAPHYLAGRVKIIATLDRRGPAIVRASDPQSRLPSIADRVPGVDVPIWYGLYGPAGMSSAVVSSINSVVNAALTEPRYVRDIQALHIANFGGTPEAQAQVHIKTLGIMRSVASKLDR